MAEVRLLPVPIAEIWDWQLRAECRDVDAAMFFPPDRERGPHRVAREARAKRVCARCPVIAECGRHALAVQEPYGVWGGLTEAERAHILRARDRVGCDEFRASGSS
jgi:WhiB family redox-sensing transcriptional regulator